MRRESACAGSIVKPEHHLRLFSTNISVRRHQVPTAPADLTARATCTKRADCPYLSPAQCPRRGSPTAQRPRGGTTDGEIDTTHAPLDEPQTHHAPRADPDITSDAPLH